MSTEWGPLHSIADYDLFTQVFSIYHDWWWACKFAEYKNNEWDKQIEQDYNAAKLNHLINAALADIANGDVKEWSGPQPVDKKWLSLSW